MKLQEQIDRLEAKLALMGVKLTGITVATVEQRDAMKVRIWEDAGCPPLTNNGGNALVSYNGIWLKHD